MLPEAEDIQKARIGVAGCGRMGQPMAEALIRSGFSVRGLDVRPASEFGEFARHLEPDPREFAQSIEILISVVRDMAETEDLLFGQHGLITGPNTIHTLVISSTLSPSYIAQLSARLPETIVAIDAPMSGASVAAKQARLAFMLGGDEVRLAWMMPVFLAMGTKLHRLGEFGAGMKTKVLNNLVAAASVTATREALRLGEAMGVDAMSLLDVMHDSSGQTWFGSNFSEIEFARDGYDPTNSIGVLTKDLECLLETLDGLDPAEREMTSRLISTLRQLRPIA